MKKIIYIIFTILTIVLMINCEDYLDSELLLNKNDQNYYSTPAEAVTALIGCYDGLQLIYADGKSFPLTSIIMSDLCFGGFGYEDKNDWRRIDQYDKAVYPSGVSDFETNWRNYYRGIFRCNMLIKRVEDIEFTNTSMKDSIIADARFIRAYHYFDLVRLFEKVPVLDEPTEEVVPQAENPSMVYKLIADDLLFSIAHSYHGTYQEIPNTDYGIVTKWAAEAMLARVFLFYTGYYGETALPSSQGSITKSEVLGYINNLITKSGHDLIENFADLWPAAANEEAYRRDYTMSTTTYAGENNKEIIFSIKYTYVEDWWNTEGWGADGNQWIINLGLRKQYYRRYGYGYGWGGATVVPKVYQEWPEGDPRRDYSIIAFREQRVQPYDKTLSKEYTGYLNKKYLPLCDSAANPLSLQLGNHIITSEYQDYFVIRFADVLLMASELALDSDPGFALTQLNKVRKRAGADTLTTIDKDIIFDERKYELAFEGIRYWDILRYENNLDYAAALVEYNDTILDGGTKYNKVILGSNLKATRGLCMIPQNQITLSGGVYEQNDGWK